MKNYYVTTNASRAINLLRTHSRENFRFSELAQKLSRIKRRFDGPEARKLRKNPSFDYFLTLTNSKQKMKTVFFAFTIWLLVFVAQASAAVLFQNNFESESALPSSWQSSPEIVSSPFGTGNAAEFDGRVDFLENDTFDVERTFRSPRLYISYDVQPIGINNSDYAFTMVFFDSAVISSVSIHGFFDGFYVFQPGERGRSLLSARSFQLYSVEHTIDLVAQTWVIDVNGDTIYQGPFDASRIDLISFSMSPWNGAANRDSPRTKVIMDNLVISTSPIPEPSVGLFLLFVFTLTGVNRRRSQMTEGV